MLEPRRRRGRHGPAGEDAYRIRTVRGESYLTSRQEHDGLTLVVKRFPGRADATDRTYLLVHGLGVSSRYFHPLAAELAKTARVFLLDLPGYGAAPDPRRDVRLADHAAVIAGFLEESQLTNPVIVGHSMGAQVVSLLAVQHPEVTDRIVMMAPTLAPAARTPWLAIRNLLWDATREPPRVFVIAVTDYLIRCGLPYLLRQLPHMLADRLEDRMPFHDAEMLVVNGDRDPIAPSGWAASLAATHPRAGFREVHGPHVIMHTDPVMIARHITEFVDAS